LPNRSLRWADNSQPRQQDNLVRARIFGKQPNAGDQAGFDQITNQANVPRQMSFEARFTF
jgi:hypothetical protein